MPTGESLPDLTALADGPLAEMAAHHGVTVAEVRRRVTAQPKPVDHDAVVDLYISGLTAQEVALRLGCAVTTVRRHVRDVGVGRRVRPFDIDDIARRYSAGQSLAEIAAAVGSGNGAVGKALQRAGVPRRPRTMRYRE